MDPITATAALVLLVGVVSLGIALWFRRAAATHAGHEAVVTRFREIASEVGGLEVQLSEAGYPTLRGLVDGLPIEIDYENYIARGMETMLGMRCQLPEATHTPSAALWVGEVSALLTLFGRARPSGDRHGIFDVYTRVEPSASEWWQDELLHDTLSALPGAGVILIEGRLTVVFSSLDAESVRTALRVPGLIRAGVQRVTLH